MAKSVGNIRGLAEVLDEVGRDALLMFFAEGHYRQPLAFSPEKLDDAARRVERIRDAGRRLVPGDSPAELAPHRDAFFDALADDYNTPRALAALAEWIREANRADGAASATPHAARDARRARAREPARRRRGRAGRGRRARRAARRRPRRARLRRGRPAARRAARARLGGPRRCRPARSSCRSGRDRARRDPSARDRLRPQRGARGAPRPARVRAVWATKGAAGDFPGARRERRRDRPALPAPTATRASAPTSRTTATRTPPRCSRARPVLVALDEVTDPQNLGAVAARPSASARPG